MSNRIKLNKNNKKLVFRPNVNQQELISFCELVIPFIRSVIGNKLPPATQNALLAATLQDWGYQTHIVSGEAVSVVNGKVIANHKDTYTDKVYSSFDEESIIRESHKNFPVSYHKWLVTSDKMIIDMSVGPIGNCNVTALYGHAVNGLPAMNKKTSLKKMFKYVNRLKRNAIAWSYREYKSDEYDKYNSMLNKFFNREMNHLTMTSERMLDECMRGDYLTHALSIINELITKYFEQVDSDSLKAA